MCQISKLPLSLNTEIHSHCGVLAYLNALISIYRCEHYLVHFQLEKTGGQETRKDNSRKCIVLTIRVYVGVHF